MAHIPDPAAASETTPEGLLRVPLDALHRELGARMSGFAGFEMPIQYPSGLKTEHLRTRDSCGLFDVSHSARATAASRRCSKSSKPACPWTSKAGIPACRSIRCCSTSAAASRTT
jgi:hypothetical protein